MVNKKINIDNLTEKELSEYNKLLETHRMFELKNDRNLFTEYVLRDRISKKKVKQSKIHKAMQYAFEHYKKVLVIVPRNSGKTSQSLAAMLYEIGQNNNIVIKIVSDGDNTASKRVNAIKQHLEHNMDFRELYPGIKPLTLGNRSLARENWGKTSLTIEREIIDLNATCLAGDSLVNMPCNREKNPNGIKIKDLVGKKDFPVYCYDIEKKIVAIGNCSGVWDVGKRKVYKVTYNWVTYSGKKSNSVIVTEDHKFLLRDGKTYKQTNELKIKDSLMPFSLSYGGLKTENHKIKSIEYVGIETVYDLSVDKYENVAVNGIIVHNCSASSITTQGVGDRADLLVFDDPCNLRNSILMPALREQVIDAYYSVWLPLLNESGRIWYFGTPYSSDDLGSLLRTKWKEEPDCCVLDFHVGQEIEITSEGKVVSVSETADDTQSIWPENFSNEFYRSAKRTMTKKAYARAYLCKAVSDSDIFFKMADVQSCLDYSFSLLENIDELEPAD